MSIALDDRLNLAEDVELGDLGIDASNYDLGVYDDFGSFDGAGGVDMNDFWGGYMGDDDFGDYGGFDDFDF